MILWHSAGALVSESQDLRFRIRVAFHSDKPTEYLLAERQKNLSYRPLGIFQTFKAARIAAEDYTEAS